MFHRTNKQSPVDQDFIWMAEYLDGTHLSEFDFQTQEENSFYDINRTKLIRFGLVGHGAELYVSIDGIFYFDGTVVEVSYKTKDKEYPLTGRINTSLDIITFKDAESALHPTAGVLSTKINQYNFGYKTIIRYDDVTFNFKAVGKVPYQAPFHLNLWLVANKKLDGTLVIRRNNRVVQELEAPLQKGVGGEVNWLVN